MSVVSVVKWTVDRYIQEKAGRIKNSCDHAAQINKLDQPIFHKMVLQMVRDCKDQYNDEYGTQGFFRWLDRIIIYKCVAEYKTKLPFYENKKVVELPKANEGTPLTIAKTGETTIVVPPGVTLIKKPGTKWCVQHKVYHPVDHFSKNSALKDGLDTSCKVARKERQDERRKAEAKNGHEYVKKKDLPPVTVGNEIGTITIYPTGNYKEPMIEPKATIGDITFTNEELDELIAISQEKIERLNVEIQHAREKIEHHYSIIQKLERRKK